MRTPRLPLAVGLSATLLAGIVAAVPSAAAPAPTTTDACLTSVPDVGGADPVQICYTLFQPAGADAGNPVPMILHSHGWGGSRTTEAADFADWLGQGFGVLSFDQRGFGESGGQAHVENPDAEGQDVMRLVDVVAGLDWVVKNGPHDPVLGAIGGSYGGGYQFVGAFTELRDRGATRFDALAPEITWWDLRESLAPQRVPRSLWVSALYAAGLDAHTPTVHQGLAFGAVTGEWAHGQAPGVADLDAFFEKNGPAWHVSEGRRLDIPVLFGQGATDNLFPLDQGLKNFAQALTDGARSQSIFVGYNGGHTLPSALPAGIGVASDPCSQQLGGGSFSDLAQRFMTEKLLGRATGLTGFGQYHLATAEGRCVTVDSVAGDTDVALGQVLTTTAAGLPVAYELGAGPFTVAGTPTLDALVTAVGVSNRAFFALSVGTSPLDAKIVQNNTLPLHEPLPVRGAARTVELPSVAVDVPAGQKLFLTVSPVVDMFAIHGSRTPGALVLDDVVVHLPVVQE